MGIVLELEPHALRADDADAVQAGADRARHHAGRDRNASDECARDDQLVAGQRGSTLGRLPGERQHVADDAGALADGGMGTPVHDPGKVSVTGWLGALDPVSFMAVTVNVYVPEGT